jgi:hypothetical protein
VIPPLEAQRAPGPAFPDLRALLELAWRLLAELVLQHRVRVLP